jgi:hypothetical protein
VLISTPNRLWRVSSGAGGGADIPEKNTQR